MSNKPTLTIPEHIALLKGRGMLFRNEESAIHFFENISYYRLKGYWWDMQSDLTNHTFRPNSYFEDVIDRYNFDRKLKLILFDAIERIEIAVRTKMIHHLSLSYGGLWYLDENIFADLDFHRDNLKSLFKEFERSREVFVKDHKTRYQNTNPDAWKIIEVASFGLLSRFFKNIKHTLPEKSAITNKMGLNIHSELSSILEAVTYIRNIIAHHSRLWNRTLVKSLKPLNNPKGDWIDYPSGNSRKKPYYIISSMLYLCNVVTPGHQ